MPARLRHVPPAVLAYTVLYLIEISVGVARSPKLWHRHGVSAAFVVFFALLWITAVVVWRWRWVWASMVIFALWAALEPAWGKWHGALVYAGNLLGLALLLTPGMRRWVGVTKRRQRPAAT